MDTFWAVENISDTKLNTFFNHKFVVQKVLMALN